MLRLTLLGLLLCIGTANAQDDAKNFTLRWYGQSFFQLTTPEGKTIVFDPHAIPEFGRNSVSADIVLCSHRHDDHTQLSAVKDVEGARVFYGLNEAQRGRSPNWNLVDEKVGAISIRTVGLYHDTARGMTHGKNAAWIVKADGLTFCHLGDLGHELSDAQLKALGSIDVLMIPVGGIYTINGGQAKRIVKQLKPRLYVLPMHYGLPGYDELLSAEEFLDGQDHVERMPKTNELMIDPKAKPDHATIVVLSWKK